MKIASFIFIYDDFIIKKGIVRMELLAYCPDMNPI